MIESHDTVSEMQLWVFLLVSLFGQFLENLSIANSLIILIGMVVYFFVKKDSVIS